MPAGVETRRFDFGESRRCTITYVDRRERIAVLGWSCDGDPPDLGNLGVYDPAAVPADVAPGDTGTVTFTAGGPTGGHWKFTKDQPGEAADAREAKSAEAE